MDNNTLAFFELVRAGLWEKEAKLGQFKGIFFSAIMQQAEEQSVVGLVTAGLEHVVDVKVPKEVLLHFIGGTLQIEQQNKAMNEFVACLIEQLRHHDIYTLLVKGQGIAQCYERPLWRSSGDVDLLLSNGNYEKAKELLIPQAVDVESEYKSFKHQGMTMKGGFVVELHGTLHSRLSKRIDKAIDNAQKDVFFAGSVRSWQNGSTQVFMPSPDNDIIFVFTHIIHHFYIEGIGLRQICDWCRLLWTYSNELDQRKLESRLKVAGVMSEWRAFAALAVDWLGIPVEAMPLYSSDKKWSHKAERIMAFVIESGNFGHKRYVAGGKLSAIWQKSRDFARHAQIFPLDSIKFYFYFVWDGIKVAMNK